MKTKTKIYGIVAFLLFVIMAILVQTKHTSAFDQVVYTSIIALRSEAMTVVMQNISHLASGGAVIFFFVALLLWRKRIGLFFIVFMGTNSLIGQMFKHLFLRPRPNILRLIEIGGYSFPSAHALTAMAMYGFLIYCLAQRKQKHFISYGLMVVFTCIILLVGVSRIYLGVHYPSDVIAGYLLSISYLCFFHYFVQKKNVKLFCA